MGDAVIGGVFLVIGLLLGNFLQWRSTEQQVRYTGLHERRARVLECLYALLYETDLAFKRWVVPFSGYDKAQQMEEVAQRYNALVDYYCPHALWLEKETQERLKTLIETMKSVFEDFSVLPQSGNPSHLRAWNEPPEEDMPKLRHEVNVRVLKEIPEQRAHLQDEFQMLLYPRRSWWRGKFGDDEHHTPWIQTAGPIVGMVTGIAGLGLGLINLWLRYRDNQPRLTVEAKIEPDFDDKVRLAYLAREK